MTKLILVGIGGFVGSVLRYLIGGLVHRMSGYHWFPFGTLVVNILGCFLIGFGTGVLTIRHPGNEEIRLFLMVGLLGGFTTFSTFSHETIHFLRDGHLVPAGANILAQIMTCLLATWFGFEISKLLS